MSAPSRTEVLRHPFPMSIFRHLFGRFLGSSCLSPIAASPRRRVSSSPAGSPARRGLGCREGRRRGDGPSDSETIAGSLPPVLTKRARAVFLTIVLSGISGCAPGATPNAAVARAPSLHRSLEANAAAADDSLSPATLQPRAHNTARTDSNPDVHLGTTPRLASAQDAPGWIGISMKQTDAGVVVASVLRSSPAAVAGLHPGDRLLRINAQSVATPVDVGEYVQALAPGAKVAFDIRRNGEVRLLHATIEAKPDRELLLRRELVGQSAPSISELRTVQGAVVPSWSQLQGHVVVLEFWASWCVACRALAPTLNQWQEEFQPLGVHILGVTMDEFEEATRASKQMAFPTFYDQDGEVTLRYQGTALPTLVLVDKQGVVADVMVGLDFERLPSLKQQVIALVGAAKNP